MIVATRSQRSKSPVHQNFLYRNLFTLSRAPLSSPASNETREEALHPTIESRLTLKIKTASLLVGTAHLDLLLHKAGFRPDEPRVPAGNPDGGQWTDEGGPGSSSRTTSSDRHVRVLQVSDDEVPQVPDRPPLRPRDRYAIARVVLRRSPLGRAALTAWRIYEVASDAFTYFDEPKTLEELEEAAKEPKTGYDIHHIVEQTPGRRDGYPESWINSPENTVRIPRFKHWEINRCTVQRMRILAG